jgi:hypothetical protein
MLARVTVVSSHVLTGSASTELTERRKHPLSQYFHSARLQLLVAQPALRGIMGTRLPVSHQCRSRWKKQSHR